MCRHHYLRSVILLPLVVAGCSTTGGSRFGGTPQSKSIAVVGDRPQPASTGEPGGQVVAEVPEPEPRRNPKTRIAGRVVDDQGEPVPNVTVRLADGGTKGGKDVQATTDRSGGFTLNGLRPGSTYSLIAEGEDAKGPLIGRIQARTADTDVEISLAAEGAGTSTNARQAARPTRAKPVSNLEEIDPTTEDTENPKVNRERSLPPVEGSDEIDPGPTPTPSGLPKLSNPQATAGWRTGNTSSASNPRSQTNEIASTSSQDSPRPRRTASAGPPAGDDDGPNPLPPAIDSDAASNPDDSAPARSPNARKPSRTRNGAKVQPSPDPGEIALPPEASRKPKVDPREPSKTETASAKVSDDPPISALEPDLESGSAESSRLTLATHAEPSRTLEPPAVSAMPPAMPPVGNESVVATNSPPPMAPPPEATPTAENPKSTNPASRPVFASDPQTTKPVTGSASSADYNPFAIVAANAVVVERSSTVPTSSLEPDPAILATSREELDTSPPVAEAPQKKWGELAATEPPPAKVEPTRPTISGSLVKRLLGTSESRDTSVALCSYDPRQQRIKDFRLPDLEGKPVRLQDLGADYVLLDFWGTWCGPCLNEIPHLIALQKKYGPSRLTVVGIACEEVPPEERKAKVEEVSRKLGINYPVLISAMDGKPCPVQKALQIQAMPTLILVDRRGQVVWRSMGSTPATRDSLDRVLASSISRADTVRR
jgi:thiol-disulfide isomerase/thioredoxin